MSRPKTYIVDYQSLMEDPDRVHRELGYAIQILKAWCENENLESVEKIAKATGLSRKVVCRVLEEIGENGTLVRGAGLLVTRNSKGEVISEKWMPITLYDRKILEEKLTGIRVKVVKYMAKKHPEPASTLEMAKHFGMSRDDMYEVLEKMRQAKEIDGDNWHHEGMDRYFVTWILPD